MGTLMVAAVILILCLGHIYVQIFIYSLLVLGVHEIFSMTINLLLIFDRYYWRTRTE